MPSTNNFLELYCRFESSGNETDYGEGVVAARFIGVRKSDFTRSAFEEGITAYTLDIVESDLASISPGRRVDEFLHKINRCIEHESCTSCYAAKNDWFLITFKQGGKSYIYKTFADSAPSFVSFESINPVMGFDLPDFPTFTESHWSSPGEVQYECFGFEVGQGMATLICDNQNGFLIDAGAGTPITRKQYLAPGGLTKNDLTAKVKDLEIQFVLSHGDGDHWRLLAWDSNLRGRVARYIVPKGVKPVALFDKLVKGKVFSLSPKRGGKASFALGNNQTLDLLRTAPPNPTANNDGIIAVFSSDNQNALIPGDCVYSDMQSDKNNNVSILINHAYAAIVVPHHGAAESANSVPNASGGSSAIAFFSAGNHKTWKHPSASSVINHTNKGYSDHQNTNPTGITAVPLL